MERKPHPLMDKKFHVKSTGCEFIVKSVIGTGVRLSYTNRDKPDVNTTIAHVERVVKLEVWKEI